MKSILLAIANQMAEQAYSDAIKSSGEEMSVVGAIVSQNSILDFMAKNNVDILVFSEGIDGSAQESPIQFVLNLKIKYPALRIIFLAGQKEHGSKDLAKLVTYQIFDILSGTSISIDSMVEKTIKPMTFTDASVFLPKSILKQGAFDDDEMQDSDFVSTTTVINKIQSEIVGDVAPPSIMDKIKEKGGALQSQGGPQVDVNDHKKVVASLQSERIQREKLQKSNEALKAQNAELNEKYERTRQEMLNRDKTRNANSKQKVIMFYGAMPGVGTTTVALNTAISLAQQKQKVAYIELNDMLPTLSYWLDLGTVKMGLEKAFLGIETRNFQDISKCILTKEKMLGLESNIVDKFEKYPASLSFMFFSEDYVKLGETGRTNPNTLKDLLLFLLYKEGYDYVILDIYSHTDFHVLETASIFSSKNVFVMTQDIVTVGSTMKTFGMLQSNGLEFEVLTKKSVDLKGVNFKNIYLINKHNSRLAFDKNKIKSWLETDKVVFIPENTEDIINGLYRATPAALFAKNKHFISSLHGLTDLF